MIHLEHSGSRLCDGISRREFLRVGGLGPLGLTLPALLQARAEASASGSFGRAKSCIQLFLWGGPGAQETWDLKPDAPAEVRGEFKPIRTSVPGTQICEHMPLLAARAHQYALIRSVTHPGTNHGTGAYHMLTGHIHFDPGTLRRPQRRDVPNLMANCSRFVSHPAELPGAVAIPHPVLDGDGEFPGQRAGFLGEQWEPFRVTGDLTRRDFRPEVLKLTSGVDMDRLHRRARLREAVERSGEFLAQSEGGAAADIFRQKALALLSSSAAYKAFDLAAEPERVRERYGWHWYAQSLVLARRLVESGVPLVTVYWNTPSLTVDESWDTHTEQHRKMKDHILPPFDRALSTLLDDLRERGLLDTTLVTWFGEFGRTPKINRNGGRDHWGPCQSIGLAGGGIKGGALLGSSTPDGGYPASEPVTPDDVAATTMHLLGIDPHQTMLDLEQRPIPLSEGDPIRAVIA